MGIRLREEQEGGTPGGVFVRVAAKGLTGLRAIKSEERVRNWLRTKDRKMRVFGQKAEKERIRGPEEPWLG